jgi:RNA polymerase sigma factor (sigma-70 family)
MGRFFEEMHEPVMRYFAKRVMDPETAWDLAGETFAATLRGIRDLQGETEERAMAWFWAIARNELRRWWERGEVERRNLERAAIGLGEITHAEYERLEELADLRPMRARIAACLELLSDDQREAVRLRVVEEHSYSEIADALGVTEDVVRKRVSRGLRQLAVLFHSGAGGPAEPEGDR